ncbi:MAG: ThiF family adenylyltransferase, partial [Gaiellaceae bacterium]
VESARETLQALNPDVHVVGYQERLSSENVMRLFADYDVIVDGCDNFPTRYLVNDACVMLGKPNVHGSIFQFEGQASVFYPGKGPCYRCLFPEPPPPGAAPSCAEAGVLGVLPGLVGCVQALETIKLILGVGKPLIGRMVYFDTLSMELRIHKLRKDPNCPVCGTHPTVTKLIDYEEFCGLRAAHESDTHAAAPA